MTTALVLLFVGLLLNGFFSCAETAFYRVNRVRLVLDARGGDFIAKSLVALSNRPTILVATVLAGGNLAHDLISFSAVMLGEALFGSGAHTAEVLLSIAITPILFVYGELLPKSIGADAPSRVLRLLGWPLIICVWLLLPVSLVLWALSKAMELLAGESPQQIQLALARKELQNVLEEGHQEGILRPAQRALAQGLLAVAERPVTEFMIPPARMPRAKATATVVELRQLARRQRVEAIAIEEGTADRKLTNYVRTIDLYLRADRDPLPIRTLVHVPDTDSHLAALVRLESTDEALAHVVDSAGYTIGFLTARHLAEPLFQAD